MNDTILSDAVLNRKVTYGRAIDRMVFMLDQKMLKDAFQASTILAVLYSMEKEQTLDDIMQARGYKKHS